MIYTQIIRSDEINNLRKKIWHKYFNFLSKLNNNNIEILQYEKKSKNVYHLFAFKTNTAKLASKIRSNLQSKKIPATFHYVPLHSSSFGKKFNHNF